MKDGRVSFFVEIARNIWFGVKVSFSSSKTYFSLKCLILLSTTFVPLLSIWLWKEVLNGIADVANSGRWVAVCLGVHLLVKLTMALVGRFDTYVSYRYNDAISVYIDNVMIEKVARMELAFFDSASMSDRLDHVTDNFWTLYDTAWLVFSILSAIINIVATFVIVSAYRIWLGVLTLLLLIPFFVYNQKQTERRLKIQKGQIRDERMKSYCYGAVQDNDIQFEIKLNGIGDYFISRYREIGMKLIKQNSREEVRHNILNGLITIVNVSSEAIVLIVSVMDVLAGVLGVGDLQYNVSMVGRLRAQASSLVKDINTFIVNNMRLRELREFMAIKPENEKSGDKMPSETPEIEFRSVWFRYPNAEQYVLKNCSFVIHPHEKVGLIGLNGSGKSTIIKLMFRFYDPECGSITLDGIDIREYDIYAVRKVFGVLFQDCIRYSLPLRETIGLSDFGERYDDEKLDRACEISGFCEVVGDWEKGYDSVLGRSYDPEGKDLSGGQWQLASLARAYFKDAEYMVLDEPSAALDPVSEDRIFEQLYRLSEGKTSVTISHRLSNTTLADKILVIDDGRIVEQGSHADLLRKGGRYAHLFSLQASRYL